MLKAFKLICLGILHPQPSGTSQITTDDRISETPPGCPRPAERPDSRPRLSITTGRTPGPQGNVQSVSEISTAHPTPARMSLLFANRDFWRLWYAGLIVFVVRWLETLAVAVFVYRATNSPFLVAMMVMLRLLPMGLFGAVLGVMAERIERRTAQIGVTALMGCTSASLAVLAYGGHLE